MNDPFRHKVASSGAAGSATRLVPMQYNYRRSRKSANLRRRRLTDSCCAFRETHLSSLARGCPRDRDVTHGDDVTVTSEQRAAAAYLQHAGGGGGGEMPGVGWGGVGSGFGNGHRPARDHVTDMRPSASLRQAAAAAADKNTTLHRRRLRTRQYSAPLSIRHFRNEIRGAVRSGRKLGPYREFQCTRAIDLLK